jgi:hypothetical protein
LCFPASLVSAPLPTSLAACWKRSPSCPSIKWIRSGPKDSKELGQGCPPICYLFLGILYVCSFWGEGAELCCACPSWSQTSGLKPSNCLSLSTSWCTLPWVVMHPFHPIPLTITLNHRVWNVSSH